MYGNYTLGGEGCKEEYIAICKDCKLLLTSIFRGGRIITLRRTANLMGKMMIKHVTLYIFLAILSPFFMPTNAHGGIDIDLNLPVGFKSISPAQFSIVRDDHLTLKGKVMFDFQIRSVSIKGTEARIDDENGFEFSRLQLREGLNTFLISMTDTSGRKRLVSYSIYSEPGGPMAGGGIASGPVVDAGAAAEGYTAPPRKKLSTRVERRTEQPKEPQKGKDQDVVFSSPYSGQVITEKELKIGGRFNTNAGITSITVNGQSCTLNMSAGTFEGPMLICPGKAREYNVNADSPKYILMKVDPKTHSGGNILEIKVTLDTGKTYEDRLVYSYYQLFVYSYTENKLLLAIWGIDPLTGKFCILDYEPAETEQTEGFNSNLFYESPYKGWLDMKNNIRTWYPNNLAVQTYCNFPNYYYEYNEDGRYARIHYPYAMHTLIYDWGLKGGDGSKVTYATKMYLHSPPESVEKYMIVFKYCSFLELENMFQFDSKWWSTHLNVGDYIANGLKMNYLSGSKDKEKYAPYGATDTYIIVDNNVPDTDFELSIDTPDYGDGYWWDMGTCNQWLICGIKYGITGDILIDSDNNGLLGGSDNVFEQISPGVVIWVNDDNDYDELNNWIREIEYSAHSLDESPFLGSVSNNDGQDEKINGIRDLEDYFPINITVPDIKAWAANTNSGLKFYLRGDGTAKIRLFKRISQEYSTNDIEYITKENSIVGQYKEPVILEMYNNKEALIDPSIFDDKGVFKGIYEAYKAGELKLSLIVEFPDKTRMVLDEAVITARLTEEFIKTLNVREGPSYDDDDVYRYWSVKESGKCYATDSSRVFIWLHGYNCTKKQAEVVAETVHERLYRTGYRGSFYAVSWDTHKYGDDPIGNFGSAVAFNADWLVSYRSGQVLADIISSVRSEHPNARIDIAAHSLGCNMISYALRILAESGDTKVDNVIFCEAAVPGETYSGIKTNNIERWIDYIPAATIVRHYFFDDMYGKSLEAVTGKVYNTFSKYDKAVDGWFRINKFVNPLPVPLNDDYEYQRNPEATGTNRKFKALGSRALSTKYVNEGKIENRSYYKSKDMHPYGIRHHGSMMDEYYYDVLPFYKMMYNIKQDSKEESENE